jgi:hypothetical protein
MTLTPSGLDGLLATPPDESQPVRWAVLCRSDRGWRRLGSFGSEAAARRFLLKAMDAPGLPAHTAWHVRREPAPPATPAGGPTA